MSSFLNNRNNKNINQINTKKVNKQINIKQINISKNSEYNLKNICIFHCENFEIFYEIIKTLPSLKNYRFIITYYNNYLDTLKMLRLDVIKYLTVENKGTNCDPFLLSFKYLLDNKNLYNKNTLLYIYSDPKCNNKFTHLYPSLNFEYSNKNIINLGVMTESKLNELYNKSKERIILNKRIGKALENLDNVNNNKYNPKSYHINMFDKANWNKNIKKKMSFWENSILINYNENVEYKYNFSNDIMVFACYPKDYSFIYTINKFLSYGIKKIYFIYSDSDFIDKKFSNLSLFKNDRIHLIKKKNIGNDFNKYYEGIKIIKKKYEDYNKVWLVNDSFLITKWNFLIYNLVREARNDIIGAFLSYQKKTHLQSYLLIMNSKILEYYYDFLNKYKFIEIKSNLDKTRLIDHLEVGLCNDIINKGVKCGVLFQIKKMFNNKINPTAIYGYHSGILKRENFYINDLRHTLLNLNHNELFLIIVFLLKKVGPNSRITVDLLKKISQ